MRTFLRKTKYYFVSFDDTLTKNKNFKILIVICYDYRIYSLKKLSKNVKFNRKHLMKQMPNIEEKKFR